MGREKGIKVRYRCNVSSQDEPTKVETFGAILISAS